jgi:hypothetical protein
MAQTDAQLNPTTLKIFYLLRSGVRLSRNKHFELFRDPKARYARRLHRLFGSLCRDLEEYGTQATIYCVLEDSLESQSLGVHIEIPVVSGRRTVFLTPPELALFAEYASNDTAEMLSTFLRYAFELTDLEVQAEAGSVLSRSRHQ